MLVRYDSNYHDAAEDGDTGEIGTIDPADAGDRKLVHGALDEFLDHVHNSPDCRFEVFPDGQRTLHDTDSILNRISEIAQKVAPEYPKIITADALEQLYSIESAYDGTMAALGDWRRFSDHLGRQLYGDEWTPEKAMEIWKPIMEQQMQEEREKRSFAHWLKEHR